MIRAVIKHCLYAYYGISRKRPPVYGIIKSLFHRGEEILGNRSSYYLFIKLKAEGNLNGLFPPYN